MIKSTIYIVKQHVLNSFPAQSEVFVCGMAKPIKTWLAIHELCAGQAIIVARAENDQSVYLVNDDEETLQIGGLSDLLSESDWITNPSMQWLALARTARAVIEQSLRGLPLTTMEKLQSELVQYERAAMESALLNCPRSIADCRKIISDCATSMLDYNIGISVVNGCRNAKRPSRHDLHRTILTNH